MKEKVKSNISELHAQIILNSIADGVFTVNKEMIITHFNKSAERITRVPECEAVGQYCFEVLRSNVCETRCPLKCSFETGESIINQQNKILRADSREIPISLSTAVIRDESGDVIGGVETFRDLSDLESLKKEITKNYSFEDICSKNHKILELFNIMPMVAESDSSVLIQGPSGSGKELFARAIHNLSFRKENPFKPINCGALPDALLDSELFGYVKGAFTDAKNDKPGRFALAENGTIFLDEVESLSMATQVKLLRVLQEKEFEPLGSIAPVKSNVRIIAATKQDVSQLVDEGKFREDLYFRLDVVKLVLPPLKDRRDDIPLLVEHFINKFNSRMGKFIQQVSNDVLTLLLKYDYPGNIRELENIMEHAFVMCPGNVIHVGHLPGEIQTNILSSYESGNDISLLKNAERLAILEVLKKNNWNKGRTAEELCIDRTTLWRKMKKFQIA